MQTKLHIISDRFCITLTDLGCVSPLLCGLLREGNSSDHHMTITYRQLLSQVCRCANVLKQMGEKQKSYI